MKNVLFLSLSLLLLGSCSESENNSGDNSSKKDSVTSNIVPIETLDSATIELIEWDSKYDVFQGEFFSIEYPSNFTASPNEPVIKNPNYECIGTDEATFTSPNNEVEFFVYSPLWGGDPKTYLEPQSNEKITEEKTKQDNSEIGLEKTIKWVTYTDQDAKYSRSFVSTKTESTHLVFGIKSVNDTAYEKYKAAYLRFKESLTQYMHD